MAGTNNDTMSQANGCWNCGRAQESQKAETLCPHALDCYPKYSHDPNMEHEYWTPVQAK